MGRYGRDGVTSRDGLPEPPGGNKEDSQRVSTQG